MASAGFEPAELGVPKAIMLPLGHGRGSLMILLLRVLCECTPFGLVFFFTVRIRRLSAILLNMFAHVIFFYRVFFLPILISHNGLACDRERGSILATWFPPITN
jgi:hypothetical protein